MLYSQKIYHHLGITSTQKEAANFETASLFVCKTLQFR